MKPLLFVLAFFLCASFSVNAQTTYNITYKGTKVMTNQTPVTTAVSGSTTLKVTQNGADVTVEMGDSGQGLWSAHIMSGQSGNNKFVAVLKNGEKSVYAIHGTITSKGISGSFNYLRYGDPSTGIVPGWTAVAFRGKK